MLFIIYLAFFGYWAFLLIAWYPGVINRRAGRPVLVLAPATKMWWAILCLALPIIGVLLVSYQVRRLANTAGDGSPAE
jgi:hypothetical protein